MAACPHASSKNNENTSAAVHMLGQLDKHAFGAKRTACVSVWWCGPSHDAGIDYDVYQFLHGCVSPAGVPFHRWGVPSIPVHMMPLSHERSVHPNDGKGAADLTFFIWKWPSLRAGRAGDDPARDAQDCNLFRSRYDQTEHGVLALCFPAVCKDADDRMHALQKIHDQGHLLDRCRRLPYEGAARNSGHGKPVVLIGMRPPPVDGQAADEGELHHITVEDVLSAVSGTAWASGTAPAYFECAVGGFQGGYGPTPFTGSGFTGSRGLVVALARMAFKLNESVQVALESKSLCAIM